MIKEERMSKKKKLIKKLKSGSSITFEEIETLLSYLSYRRHDKGRTSGSRVCFISETTGGKIEMHKPHPSNEMKRYVVKMLIEYLEKEGLI